MSPRFLSSRMPSSSSADVWQATKQDTGLATRLIGDQDDYLAGGHGDVGRRTAPDEHELFVSCSPEIALQQQFEHLRPSFLTVHDIATGASRKLLAGIAAASGRSMQRLAIRRQGYGTVLAVIEFVELPTTDGTPLRLYSTAAEADTAARQGVARMLLAFSRIGAVMVGDLPAHAIGSALAPLHEAMLGGPWPNRELLLLPLAAGTLLAAQAASLARGSGVNVRATPQVSRPADAWGYINGTWTRLRERTPPDGARLPQLSGAPAGNPAAERSAADDAYPARIERRARRRTPLQAVPAAGGGSATSGRGEPAPDPVLERYVTRIAELPGVCSCCIVDVGSGRTAAFRGTDPPPAELAAQSGALLAAIGRAGQALDAGTSCEEVTLTFDKRHLLLRALPGLPGMALCAALDKVAANLTLARLQIQRLDTTFGAASRH